MTSANKKLMDMERSSSRLSAPWFHQAIMLASRIWKVVTAEAGRVPQSPHTVGILALNPDLTSGQQLRTINMASLNGGLKQTCPLEKKKKHKDICQSWERVTEARIKTSGQRFPRYVLQSLILLKASRSHSGSLGNVRLKKVTLFLLDFSELLICCPPLSDKTLKGTILYTQSAKLI